MNEIIVEVTGAGGATNLQALTDVDTGSAANGQVLTYNGTQWVPTAAAGVSELGSLNDVDLTGVQDGYILTYDSVSGNFITEANAGGGGFSGSYNDLTDVPATFTPSAHTHTASDITDLSSYTGFDARYYTEGETDSLLTGKANTVHTHVKADITDLNDGDYATAAQGLLADSAIQPGDNLSALTNDAGFITSVPAISIDDLTDVDTSTVSPVTGQVLKWNGTGWAPANDESASGGGVTELNELNDVALGTPVTGEVLKYNGTTWTDSTIAYSELTGVPATFTPSAHTHVEADITDLDKYTQAQVDSLLSGKANTVHTHTTSDITDLSSYTGFDARYYTETEVDSLLSGKADGVHTHVKADITDFNDGDYATAAQGALADTALQNIIEDTTPQLGGELDAQSNKIVSLAEPTLAQDAATKNYVDTITTVNGQTFYKISTATTNATPAVVQSIPVTSGSVITFEIRGRAIDTATGDTFGFTLGGCVKNYAGVTEIVGSNLLTEYKDAGATAWDIIAQANDGTDVLEVQVTGEAAHNLAWDYTMTTTEV